LSSIWAWYSYWGPGFDSGSPRPDTSDPGNEIGDPSLHVPAPATGVYYSFTEQNCVWWATIQLELSGIRVPTSTYNAISSYNLGVGAAAQVIAGTRSASTANRLTGPTPSFFMMSDIVQDIECDFGF